MSEVGISHQNNYDIDQPDIVDLLDNDFSSTLHKWRDLYPTGLPNFAKHIGSVLLMTLILRSIPFLNILLVFLLIFHLEFLDY